MGVQRAGEDGAGRDDGEARHRPGEGPEMRWKLHGTLLSAETAVRNAEEIAFGVGILARVHAEVFAGDAD